MAIRAKLVSFTAPLVAGAQAIAGVGFQGKLAYFFAVTTGVVDQHCNLWVGIDDGITHICRAFADRPFAGADNSDAAWSTGTYSLVFNRALAINQIAQTGYVSAFTTDGFTIQWDTVGFAPMSTTCIALVVELWRIG